MDDIAEIKKDITALQVEASAQSIVIAGLMRALLQSGSASRQTVEQGFEEAMNTATIFAMRSNGTTPAAFAGEMIKVIDQIRLATFGK